MKFAPEGRPFIAAFAAISIMAFFALGMAAAVVPLVLTFFMAYFFRDPERVIPEEKDILVSPADGRIIVVDKTLEDEFLKSECTMISIFMSPLNVHVNRVPCDCKVVEVRHKKGRFLSAFKPEASLENESISLLIETEYGRLLLRQVAGLVARRAVCRVKEGDVLKRGERFGIIKFSSRVDIYIPISFNATVKFGDKVKAGETVIGALR